jgi:hypothetical protein
MPEGKRPIEQEAVKTTIVGGRPPGSGKPVGPIPRGIEVLIKKAAVDPDFKALLVAKRAEAAKEIGLALDPAEAMMLKAAPADQLEAIIARTTVAPSVRAAFLGRAAAVMLVALGAGAIAGCDWVTDIQGERPDRPPATQPAEPAKPTPPAQPPTDGIRPDRPAAKPAEPAPPANEAAPPTVTARPHTNMPWAGVAPGVTEPPGLAPSLPDRPPTEQPAPPDTVKPAPPDAPSPAPPPPAPPLSVGGVRPDRPPTPAPPDANAPAPAPPSATEPSTPPKPNPSPPVSRGIRPDRPTVKPEAAPAKDQRPGQPPTAGRGGSRPDRPAPNPEPKPDDTQ